MILMKQDRIGKSIGLAEALRHPGVIALIVAGLAIAVLLLVEPWGRARIQPAHIAMHRTTGEAARAAGAAVLPTQPKSPIEPARPKTSPAVNPVTP